MKLSISLAGLMFLYDLHDMIHMLDRSELVLACPLESCNLHTRFTVYARTQINSTVTPTHLPLVLPYSSWHPV